MGILVLLACFLYLIAWFSSRPIVITIPVQQPNSYELHVSHRYWQQLPKDVIYLIDSKGKIYSAKIKNISSKEFLILYLQSPLQMLEEPRIKLEEKSVLDLLIKGKS